MMYVMFEETLKDYIVVLVQDNFFEYGERQEKVTIDIQYIISKDLCK